MQPAGWPADLPDPDDPEFAARAVAWLLDLGPGHWRQQRVLREQPLVLAVRARHDVDARLQGARAAYAAARTELGDAVPPPIIEALLESLEAEGAWLLALQREVGLVEEALRGRRWRARL